MFVLLLIIIMIFFGISFFWFKKDLFSPCVIVCAMFCISGLCALYNYDVWGLENYNSKTVFIILIGIFTFFVFSSITYYLFEKKSMKKGLEEKCKKFSLSTINVSKILKIFSLALICFCIIWKLYDVIKVSKMFGEMQSLSGMIGFYRGILSYSRDGISYNAPFLLNQLEKIVTVISYIYIYIIIRNLFCNDKIKNNMYYIFYLFLFVIYITLTGGRMPLLKLASAAILFCYFFANRKSLWSKQKENSIKYIKIGMASLLILFISFYAFHGIMGRNRNFRPDYYVTMYAGGSLKLLDMYIEKPVKKTGIFGKETFYNVNKMFSRLGFREVNYVKHLEFRKHNGLFLGNVYTPFRNYYADFGVIGLIVLVGIFSVFINSFYLVVKKKTNDINNDLYLLVYGLIVYCLFLFSIVEQFYTVIVSTTYFLMILLMIIIYKFILKYSIITKVSNKKVIK